MLGRGSEIEPLLGVVRTCRTEASSKRHRQGCDAILRSQIPSAHVRTVSRLHHAGDEWLQVKMQWLALPFPIFNQHLALHICTALLWASRNQTKCC